MVRGCVWSRNLVNEEALAHCGLSHQKQTKFSVINSIIKGRETWIESCCLSRVLLSVAAKHSITCLNRKSENGLQLNTAFFNNMTQKGIMSCNIQITTSTTTKITTIKTTTTRETAAITPGNWAKGYSPTEKRLITQGFVYIIIIIIIVLCIKTIIIIIMWSSNEPKEFKI